MGNNHNRAQRAPRDIQQLRDRLAGKINIVAQNLKDDKTPKFVREKVEEYFDDLLSQIAE